MAFSVRCPLFCILILTGGFIETEGERVPKSKDGSKGTSERAISSLQRHLKTFVTEATPATPAGCVTAIKDAHAKLSAKKDANVAHIKRQCKFLRSSKFLDWMQEGRSGHSNAKLKSDSILKWLTNAFSSVHARAFTSVVWLDDEGNTPCHDGADAPFNVAYVDAICKASKRGQF